MRKIGKYVLVSSLLLNQITPLAMAAEEVSQSIVEGQNLNEEFKGLELIEMSEKLDEVTNQTSGAEETEFSTTIMEESETKIDVSTLKVSSSFATLGDIITISVAIRDEVNHASIQLFNSGSQGLYSQSVGLSYNAETGLYEAQLEITNQIASGNWSINYIEYYDGSGTYYSLHDVNSGMGTTANLSAIKFTVDGTTLDYNIPAIDLESLSVSQSEAVGGDSVIYSLAVSDDTGVSEVWMEFYNLEANQSKTLYFEYNEVSQRFEGDFQIEQYNISNGLWQVKNITTSNFVNNSLTIYNSDFSDYEDAIDLSSLNLTVSENEVYNEEPVINLDSLTISATEAKGGDAITYSVEVTDNAGVSGTYIYLYNPETRKSEYLYLNLNEETNRYEGIFYINTYGTESGVWKISQISAYDIGSNSVTHYNSDIEEHSWSEKKSDLTAYNLTVSGTEVDHETPKLNVESLNVSKKVATLGDSITYSVEVTDNNGNPDVNLRVYNIETEENSYLNLQFNEETNRFEGMFNIDDNTVSGTWIIESIYASDNSNNRVDVYNNNIEQNSSYENAMDLSAFDVLVSGTNPDRSAPAIDIANLQVNLKEAKFGDLIEYTVPATDDTEVSSGNIYFTNRGEASEKSESAYFYYDEKNDVYKAYVKVGKNLTKGDLLIESLSFYDVHGNVAIVYNKQLNPSDEDAVDLSNLNVYIDGYDPSQVPSTEELAGFTISKEFIENGVEVTYNIPSLGEKKYDHGYVHLVNNYYYHQDMSRTIKLTKSSVGELEGKTEFYNRSVYSRVAFLELWDEDGNYITYKNEDFYPNDLDAVNLDWLDTQVTQKDTTAPTINLNSLTVNKTEATVDDKVIFSIKVADESKIRNGFVTLSSEKYSKEEYLNFVFDKATDSYSAELNITEDFADGSWVISRIEFSDYAENISEIYNQKLYPDDMNSIDLSQFDVTVSGTDYDGEAPEIDLTSLSVNKKKCGRW